MPKEYSILERKVRMHALHKFSCQWLASFSTSLHCTRTQFDWEFERLFPLLSTSLQLGCHSPQQGQETIRTGVFSETADHRRCCWATSQCYSPCL